MCAIELSRDYTRRFDDGGIVALLEVYQTHNAIIPYPVLAVPVA